MITRLAELGLNTEYWKTDPVIVKLGDTNIIKGVEQSLLGCREGDRVEVYMTLETAYESEAVGIVPNNSSVVWIFTITSVVKGA
jgi:FKBP-type peptidyl-prolyl cis-trans isomerase 2